MPTPELGQLAILLGAARVGGVLLRQLGEVPTVAQLFEDALGLGLVLDQDVACRRLGTEARLGILLVERLDVSVTDLDVLGDLLGDAVLQDALADLIADLVLAQPAFLDCLVEGLLAAELFDELRPLLLDVGVRRLDTEFGGPLLEELRKDQLGQDLSLEL